MKMVLIAAVAKNGVIGSQGAIPWHSKEDFKHFKETTLGFPVIMGLKTFESLGKPLPGRTNIVLSNLLEMETEGENPIYFNNLDSALNFCEKSNFERVFIIGGGSLYSQTITIADEMILSFMNLSVKGDVFFPYIDPDIWILNKEVEKDDFVIKYFSKIASNK